MSYLLDTCIISKLRRISKYPDPKLEIWFQKHPANLYFISAVSIGEIQIGISQIKEVNEKQRAHKAVLEDWLVGELIPAFHGRILPLDLSVMLAWGILVGKARQQGIVLPTADSMIAATAIHHGLVLVTDNQKDFIHSNTPLYNPWKQ